MDVVTGTRRSVGIDIGGTAIKAGAVDANGTVLERRSVPLDLASGAESVLDRIAELARALGAERELGVGIPGLLDRARGVLLDAPNLKPFAGLALRAELARRLGFAPQRISIENDANAAAWGEQWLGASRGERDFLFVTLGTGVGGGLILGGALYTGPGGMAGEIGHVVVDPFGERCGCGARGCVETKASATAARRRALAAGLPHGAPGDLVELARAARASDGPERALFAEIGRDLGRGLAAAVSLLDLRCFVVGGGFGAALDLLAPGILSGIREASYGRSLDELRVLPATLGADAGWIGAARLCLASPS